MTTELNDMVAVLTGSTSGFGKAVALQLAARGASVVISGRREEEGQKVVEECKALNVNGGGKGNNAIFVPTDVTSDASVANLFAVAKQTFGKVTAVFVNAGVMNGGNYVDDDDTAGFDAMLDVNIKGMTYSARHGFRALKENNGGALVFTSSVGGSMSNGSGEPFPAGDAVFSIYTATKSYLDCLARGATSFDSKHNIRTYTVSPSVYLTGMNGNDSANADPVSMVVNPIIKDYAGDANDVAAVVEAMFDGTTKWESGSNVSCEGPYTYNVHERYQMMYDPKYFGVASPALPLEILCNHLGEPVTVTEETIASIQKEYKQAYSIPEEA